MSERSNGMMANLGRPGKLEDLAERVLIKNDPASPIAEPEAPAPTPGSKPRTVSIRSGKGTGVLGIAAAIKEEPKFRREKVPLNTRVDDFIDAAIQSTLRELEDSDRKEFTKEDVVVLALIKGFDLTPPEGWKLRS